MSKQLIPPRGWRFLAQGEAVQAGDKCWFRSRWDKVDAHEVGHVMSKFSFPRARRIAPSAAKREIAATVRRMKECAP